MSVSPKSRLRQSTQTANNCQFKGGIVSLQGDIVSGQGTLNKAHVVHIVAEMASRPPFPATGVEVYYAG